MKESREYFKKLKKEKKRKKKKKKKRRKKKRMERLKRIAMEKMKSEKMEQQKAKEKRKSAVLDEVLQTLDVSDEEETQNVFPFSKVEQTMDETAENKDEIK